MHAVLFTQVSLSILKVTLRESNFLEYNYIREQGCQQGLNRHGQGQNSPGQLPQDQELEIGP